MADLADLAAEKKIVVYVSGAVARPGVVRLAENARAYEAVEACGGVLPNADMAAVNLAQPLKDGMQVNVAAVAVKEENSPRPKKESESAALININTADSETLMKLNGVGKATAAAIIEYRKREGSFRSIEDLKKVSGIGEKKFERISSQVTL
jgi:competence protein ComEA